MRVLYLCHRIPYPPDKGDKIRAFRQVCALAARHEVDVFTLADDASDLSHESKLRSYCRRLTVAHLNPLAAKLRSLPALLTKAPLTVPYFYSAELAREVRQALLQRSYDRIVVYCSAMAQYVEASSGIPVVTDFVDVDSDKWMQYATHNRFPYSMIYKREGRTLRNYERLVCERSSRVLVTTEREARLVREISEATPVDVIPNGVDTEYFKPSDDRGGAVVPTIGFTGDMSYFPNQEAVISFAREVLPLIRKKAPSAFFLIVGRKPGRNVQKLQNLEGVEVTGFVPDVRPYLARMQVSVAPFSIAAGIQNKILEAMAYEIPVVATARAAQGLSRGAAAAIDIAQDAGEMAEAIVHLLGNSGLSRNKGIEARRQVTTDYNWDQALNRFLQVVEEIGAPHAQSSVASPIF